MTNLYNIDVVCCLGGEIRHFKTLLKQPFCKVLKGRAELHIIGFLCVKCSSFSYYWI